REFGVGASAARGVPPGHGAAGKWARGASWRSRDPLVSRFLHFRWLNSDYPGGRDADGWSRWDGSVCWAGVLSLRFCRPTHVVECDFLRHNSPVWGGREWRGSLAYHADRVEFCSPNAEIAVDGPKPLGTGGCDI